MTAIAGVILGHDASRAHGGTGSALVVSVTVLVASLVIGIWMIVYLARHLDEPGDWGEGGDGRGGGRGPNPRTPGPSSEPDWWPQFERQFAAHVRRSHTPSR